jgi:catechol 2,3-dioxygenase
VDGQFQLGQVKLNVNDLDLVSTFYEKLGFKSVGINDTVTLSLNDNPLLILYKTTLPRKNEVGLYHFGLKVSTVEDFISCCLHLEEQNVSISGGREFPCMKSIYFRDPEHNGIELYVDLPAKKICLDEETRAVMDPLNLNQLVESSNQLASPLPSDTIIGRIHLHVLALDDSEAYYTKHFGLTKTYEGTNDCFFSKDHYEDYLGLNTWLPGRPSSKDFLSPGIRNFAVHMESSLFDELYGSKETKIKLIDPNAIHSTVYRGL